MKDLGLFTNNEICYKAVLFKLGIARPNGKNIMEVCKAARP
jgi:hypothetical protein